MANTLATPHWDEIRRLAEQGVPFPDLAEEYGVAVKSIYNKSASEDWLTPSRVKAKVNSLAEKRASYIGKTSLLRGEPSSEKSDSLLLDTWENRAASLRTLSFDVALQAIKESKGQIVIESASDLKHAVHVARQATGLLDADSPAIQVSLFGNTDICGPSVMENVTQSFVELQDVQEDADFWG